MPELMFTELTELDIRRHEADLVELQMEQYPRMRCKGGPVFFVVSEMMSERYIKRFTEIFGGQ